MKYTLDLPPSIVERIYQTAGTHPDFSMRAFILLAIENQLEMESSGRSEPPEQLPNRPDAEGQELHLPSQVADLIAEPVAAEAHADPLDGDARSDTTDADGTPWIWGQVNRVLPIKFVLRVLANAGRDSELTLEEAQKLVGFAGREYGLYLRELDDRAERGRVARLSVGFPTAESQKDAISRFQTHYLGKRRGDGRVAGAPFTLGLVGTVGDNGVGLTEAGALFARLENPILDSDTNGHPTLTEDEATSYLEHCRHQVPGETKAFTIILAGLVHDDAHSTDALNALIAETVGQNWTKTMVSTQRSGTMGRMIELGLVDRQREGRRVKFTATDRGREFLKRAKHNE